MNSTRSPFIIGISSFIFGIFFIYVLNIFLFSLDGRIVADNEPLGQKLASILLDRGIDGRGTWPLSIQSLTWIVFFVAMGSLIHRWLDTRKEAKLLSSSFLPEDDTTVLIKSDLGSIFKSTNSFRDRIAAQVIRRIIRQVQVSDSISQASSVLDSSLELSQHELDTKYSFVRYLMWLIPTLGFIGTVMGVADALNYVGGLPGDEQPDLQILTERLGVAFYTTLLSLLLAAILVFFVHIIQSFEERNLNKIGQYCLDNLVNRLLLTEPVKVKQ